MRRLVESARPTPKGPEQNAGVARNRPPASRTRPSSTRSNDRWIGIEITNLAVTLIKQRLRDSFGEAIDRSRATVGEPVSLPDAEALAAQDPYQIPSWALGLVGARRLA